MITCFPTPLPDELLYSVCARYSDRVRYPSPYGVKLDLFGSRTTACVVDLPSHLNHLVAALPPGHLITVDTLIQQHTLLPFYAPFLTPERNDKIRAKMYSDKGQNIHMLAGIIGRRIPFPSWLRFCPICVQVDRDRFGECYWHRLHQVPGVEVCPEHEVLLQNSCVRSRNAKDGQPFISAEAVLGSLLIEITEITHPYKELLLRIARDVVWLLQQDVPTYPQGLHNRYMQLLASLGYARHNGRLQPRKLVSAVKEHYSFAELSLFNSEISEGVEAPWPVRAVSTSKETCHPIQHLLLTQFLGCTAEEFFTLSTKITPFGEAPWPCLNPVCEYFRVPKIKVCKIQYIRSRNVLMGSFACECGFEYTRKGPDTGSKDQFRYTRIDKYGPVWQASLRTWWNDPSISEYKISKWLQVSRCCLRGQAYRLGLSFPRPTGKTKRINPLHIPRSQEGFLRTQNQQTDDRLVECREEFLRLRQEYPDAGIKVLRSKMKGKYWLLEEKDREWLSANKPPSKRFQGRPRLSSMRVDWDARDIETSKATQLAATHLKNNPDRPVWITKNAIISEIVAGYSKLFDQHLDKLPLTKEVLDEVTETYEEFAVRKVEWATDHYLSQHVHPNRSTFIRYAGVAIVVKRPVIEKAVNDALQAIRAASADW